MNPVTHLTWQKALHGYFFLAAVNIIIFRRWLFSTDKELSIKNNSNDLSFIVHLLYIMTLIQPFKFITFRITLSDGY